MLKYIRINKVKNVLLVGYIKNIKKLLIKSEIFVHTSLFEGMSNAVLEAMSYGIPSVVLDSPGVSELHVHKKTGYISKNNINKFSNYLLILSRNKKIQKLFFKNSLDRIKKYYSVKKTLQSYNKYL